MFCLKNQHAENQVHNQNNKFGINFPKWRFLA